MVDHYRTLDVASDATAAELRSAYLKLARAHHPDQFAGAERTRAEARMQQINVAWNVLGSADTRKAYDATRGPAAGGVRGRAGGAGGGAGGAGARRGNATFRPFDDGPDGWLSMADLSDADLDPTPLTGSRGVPRWISFMPVFLVAGGLAWIGLGLLLNASAVIALALVAVALGAVGFVMMPLIVMSRAERDPNL